MDKKSDNQTKTAFPDFDFKPVLGCSGCHPVWGRCVEIDECRPRFIPLLGKSLIVHRYWKGPDGR